MALRHSARLLHAALALTFGLSVPLAAQEAAPAAPTAPAAEAVTIPFAPPLGTPLPYRLRFERKRERGDSVVDFDQRLTFAKAEGGYVLTLETLSFSSGGQRFDLADRRVLDAVPPALKIYLLPMKVELDDSGEMVRMLDWPAMRATLRDLPEAFAALSGEPVNEGALEAVRSVLEPIINASAEDAPGYMIRGWPAVLGHGGMKSTSGAAMAYDTEIVTPFAPDPLPAEVESTVTRTSDGKLYFIQSVLIDPEALRALTAGMAERLKAQAAANSAPDPADEIRALDVKDQIGINFDPVTGLPVTARVARLSSVTTPVGTQTGGDIVTIGRIAP